MAAVDIAMEKARAASIGMVVVANTTHTGALGCYTQALARQGFAAIAMTATGPLMLYHGAAAAAAGTNPISIAVPGAGASADPIVLDMTTGATSLGHILQARRSGQPLAPGLAADENGRPVTDPQLARLVMPLGGAKGAGLSLMIELLASHLAGNPIVAEALQAAPGSKRHRQNALLLAIDCARFVEPDVLAEAARRLVAGIKGLPRADAAQEVRLPGERGDEVAAQRRASGIPLPATVLAELRSTAAGLQMTTTNYWD
jgi:ureidoglycolate dehydrogenase (NAD+)